MKQAQIRCSSLIVRLIPVYVTLAIHFAIVSYNIPLSKITNNFLSMSFESHFGDSTSSYRNDKIWNPSDRWIHDCVRQVSHEELSQPDDVQWVDYRLGDCIRDCRACLESINASHLGNLSIAGQYWMGACQTKRAAWAINIPFFSEIFDRYKRDLFPHERTWDIPDDDEIVVHLSIDDATESFLSVRNMTPFEMLRSGVSIEQWAGDPYPDGFGSISEYLDLFQELGLQKVAIRISPPEPQLHPNFTVYTTCLVRAFEEAGFTTERSYVNVTHNPDQDFYFMAHAANFVPGAGTYSQIISRVVTMRGGKIVQPRKHRAIAEATKRSQNLDRHLVYMTTIFSEHHQNVFKHCWPELLKKSKLLQTADIIIFSNNNTEVEQSTISFVQELFSKNPSFRFEFASNHTLWEMQNPYVRNKSIRNNRLNKFQFGANEAVHQGFANSWFSNFSWIMRINPDVMIVNSTWILQTMKDPTVDGIFVDCQWKPDQPKIHTDFFVVRPSTCRGNAFGEMVQTHDGGPLNHEMTAGKEFEHIIRANRHRWLPDNRPSRTLCRVRGPQSSVIHDHNILEVGPNGTITCRMLESLNIT